MPPAEFAATLPHHITSAGVLVADDQHRILMLRQAHGYPGHPAWWQIPGGLSDPDETPPATALRELREEAGVLHHHPLLPLAVDYRTLDQDGWGPVVDFTFTTDPVPAGHPVRLSPEHDTFAWRTAQEWLSYRQPLQRNWFKSIAAAHRSSVPAFLLDGRPMA
ncbi:NUDIX hydrolase [Kitasatospora purpeofusca]|uniref:NUDIX hydrolase n=1 Tax=Kitasatospora purpeofusca TaxID=67352 RepID=UPI0035DAC6B8